MKFKKILAVLMVIGLLGNIHFEVAAIPRNDVNNVEVYVPEDIEAIAEMYADECLFEFSNSVESDDVFYYEQVDNLRLADPYIIYHATDETQDEIFNFPVYDEFTGNIVYIIETFCVEDVEGYICNVSDNYVDFLNDMDYINNSDGVLIYLLGNVVYFDNNEIVYDGYNFYDDILSEFDWGEEEINFIETSFEDKKELISERMANMDPFVKTQI